MLGQFDEPIVAALPFKYGNSVSPGSKRLRTVRVNYVYKSSEEKFDISGKISVCLFGSD